MKLTLPSALELAKLFAFVCVGYMFLQIGVEVHKTGAESRKLISETRVMVSETEVRLKDTSQNLNAILLQTGLAADQARRASEEQRVYLKKLNGDLSQTIVHVDRVLIQTEKTVAQLGDTTQHMESDVHAVMDSTVTAVDTLPALVQQSTATMKSAQVLLDDPSIPKTLAQANRTITAVAGVAENVQTTTSRIDKKVEQMMKPASLLRRILTGALNTGYKIAVLARHSFGSP